MATAWKSGYRGFWDRRWFVVRSCLRFDAAAMGQRLNDLMDLELPGSRGAILPDHFSNLGDDRGARTGVATARRRFIGGAIGFGLSSA
jgi:hypothetical protein